MTVLGLIPRRAVLPCLLLLLLLGPLVALPQGVATTTDVRVTQETELSSPRQWRAVRRAAHETEWESVRLVTNRLTGAVRARTNAVIELADGLNQINAATGKWRAASPAFRITEQGAVADRASLHVTLAPNVNVVGAVKVRKGGVGFAAHPLCVAYYDPEDGQFQVIATLRDAVGWVVGDGSEVVYSNCFNGITASLQYRSSLNGLEQNLLLEERPAITPTDLGMSARARLELFSEIVGDTPDPQVSNRALEREADPVLRSMLFEPDFVDQTLRFGGALKMGRGRAFLNTRSGDDRLAGDSFDSPREVTVGKRILKSDGRRVVVEAVEYRRIQAHLDRLRASTLRGVTNAALLPLRSPGGEMLAGLTLSRSPGAREGGPEFRVAGLPSLPPASPAPGPQVSRMQMAANPVSSRPGGNRDLNSASIGPKSSGSGQAANTALAGVGPVAPVLVLDWHIVGSSGDELTGYQFRGTNTYLIVNEVSLLGQTVLHGGTILKFAPYGSGAAINILGGITCDASDLSPIILTGRDEDLIGDVVPNSTGTVNPYGYGADYLRILGSSPAILKHLRLLHSGGYAINLLNGAANNELWHSQVVSSGGIWAENSSLKVRNVLLHDVTGLIEGLNFSVDVQHVTAHTVWWGFADDWGWNPGTFTMANSLLSQVPFKAGYSVPPNVIWSETEIPNLFETVGAGAHYLKPGTHQDSPVGAAIDPALAADLARRTTVAPEVLDGTIAVSQVLAPRSIGDLPPHDLGFHYPIADFAAHAVIENATVLLTNGVTVVGFGSYAFLLKGGAQVISEGGPAQMNHCLPYLQLQEQTFSWGPYYRSGHTFYTYPSYGGPPAGPALPDPIVRVRFTRLDRHLVGGGHVHVEADYRAADVSIRDSHVIGGEIIAWGDAAYTVSVGITNNVIENTFLGFYMDPNVSLFNNTFLFSELDLWFTASGNPAGGGDWLMRDNIFDHCRIGDWLDPWPGHSHNAYVASKYSNNSVTDHLRFHPEDITDVVLANGALTYATGLLGRHYLPETATSLINHGSRTASAAGLFHQTTQLSQVKDTGNVDLGAHFVAAGTMGGQVVLLDSDGDGLADFLEDLNGDNAIDVGETSWTDADSDCDGRNDWDEIHVDRTNPLNPGDALPVRLGYWRFNDQTWMGEAGQLPLLADSLQNPVSWSGRALGSLASPARLRYREIEANGRPNLTCRRGTVQFWYRPGWTSSSLGGSGPGAVARLIEVGSAGSLGGWISMSISSTGDQISLESSQGGNSPVTHFSHTFGFKATQWHQIAVTYSGSESRLFIDGVLRANGSGLPTFLVASFRPDGFGVGSSLGGGETSGGWIDELETYNHVRSATQVANAFEQVAVLDSDHDRLTDLLENSHGSSSTLVDTDYDGRSDWEEVMLEQTIPNDPASAFRTNLAHFAFNRAGFVGNQGQIPVEKLNVAPVPSWSGSALSIGPATPARLRYLELRPTTSANINLRSGTIQFWFKPNWGPAGPGQKAYVLEVGNPASASDGWLAIYFDASGQYFRVEGTYPGEPHPRVLMEVPVQLLPGTWELFTLVYSPDEIVDLYVNEWNQGSGSHWTVPSTATRAQYGFTIGSDQAGMMPIAGEIEEFRTFNYRLSQSEVSQTVQRRQGITATAGSFVARINPVQNGTSVFVEIDGSMDGLLAWGVGSAIPDNPTWGPMQSFTFELEPGEYTVWVGFRDLAGATVWRRHSVVVDTTPPQPVVVHPASTILASRTLQLEGTCTEDLQSVTCVVTRSGESPKTYRGTLKGRHYDVAVGRFAPVTFQFLDVALSPGLNQVELTLVDRAGNQSTTTITYTVDELDPERPAPTLLAAWPPTGAKLSGPSFTFRGRVDNPDITVWASYLANGESVQVPGSVERNGMVWIPDIPLKPGANSFEVHLRDKRNVATVAALSVERSSVNIAVDPIDFSRVASTLPAVTCNVDPGYTIWVNGAKAQLTNDVWVAEAVLLNPDPITTIEIVAIPNGDNDGNGSAQVPAALPDNVNLGNPTSGQAVVYRNDLALPLSIRLKAYSLTKSFVPHWDPCPPSPAAPSFASRQTISYSWKLGVGGPYSDSGVTESCDPPDAWNLLGSWDAWEVFRWNNCPGCSGRPTVQKHPWEHCDYTIERRLSNFAGTDSRGAQSTVEMVLPGPGIPNHSAIVRVRGVVDQVLDVFDPLGSQARISPGMIHVPGIGASLIDIGQGLGETNVVMHLGNSVDLTPALGWADATSGKIVPYELDPDFYYFMMFGEIWRDWDVDIDSDNDNGRGPPERNEEEENLENWPATPGKIIIANKDDPDRDGIPGFADGFGANAGTNGTASFVPLTIELHSPIDLKGAQLIFDYPDSDPALVSEVGGVYRPGPGNLRIWRRNGPQSRSPAAVGAGGDFIPKGTPVSVGALVAASAPHGNSGGVIERATIELWVEGIAASSQTGDAAIKVRFDPDGAGPQPFVGAPDEKVVRVSVVEIQTVEPTGSGATEPRDVMVESHAAPFFPTLTVQLARPRADQNGNRLVADLLVTGTVESRLCDLVPGPGGAISAVRILLNGDLVSVPLVVTGSKGGPQDVQQDLRRPYPFHGTFSLSNVVEISTGNNSVTVEASDEVPGSGLTGFREFQTTITAEPVLLFALAGGPSPGPYDGFAFVASAFIDIAGSNDGELHAFLQKLKGPIDVLDYLTYRENSKVVRGPNGEHFVADPNGKPSAVVIQAAKFVRLIGNPTSLDFKAGFVKGFLWQGAEAIVGTAELAITAATIVPNHVIVILDIESTWATEQVVRFHQGVDQVRDAGEALYQVVVALHAQQSGLILDVASGDAQSLWGKSEALGEIGLVALEAMMAAADGYANATAFEQGEIQGRIALEVASMVIPATKMNLISKATILNELVRRLDKIDLFRKYPAVVKNIQSAIDSFPKLPEFCFVAGTLVETEFGARPIETIQSGDLVLSRDEISGDQRFKRVVSTVVTHPDRIYHLSYRVEGLDGQNGIGCDVEVLSSSGPHPFYVLNREAFVPAEELNVGEKFTLATGGNAVLERIDIELAPTGLPFSTYNFEVEHYNTYFVGEAGVWVHNQGSRPCRKIDTLTRTLIRKGTPRRHAMLEAMKRVKSNTGMHSVTERLRSASDFMMDSLPGSPTGEQMAEIFTIRDYRALMNSKEIRVVDDGVDWIIQPGAQGQRGHHIVTRRIQQELQGRFGVNITDIDDSPVKVFTYDEHQGPGNSLHNFMNTWNDGALTPESLRSTDRYPSNQPGLLIDELLRFYKSQPNNPDWVRMAKATRGWANQKGIPISQ